MRHRSPARWLAPLALFACVVAVAGVIGQSLRPERRATIVAGSSAEAQTISSRDGGSGSPGSRHRYTVRPGDTLTGIAARTGVPLERLRQLNPKLDSESLHPGQRIKLSP